jgi:hypothetical protein
MVPLDSTRRARFRGFACGVAIALAAATGCDRDDKDDGPPPPPPPPAIATISPVSGPDAGGTAVTITGTDLNGVDSVTFGGSAGTGITLTGSTQIVVTTPSGTAGPADVVLTRTATGATTTETNGFTFINGTAPAPTVTGCSPAGGPVAGATICTVTGSGFQTGATVTVGAATATGVQVITAGRLVMTTPAGTVGPANVVVTNPDAQFGTLPNGFTYSNPPTVTGISPTLGFTDGGDTVTISGTNFVPGATADIGGAPLTIVSLTAVQITGTTGPRGPGTVAVTVTNPGAISGSGAGYTYRYGPNSQTNAFTFDTATGIDCRRRWWLNFRAIPVQTDLLAVGLQTPTAADTANAYALDWFRGYVLSAVNQIYGRNADGTGVSGSSINITFVGLAPSGGSVGCSVPSTDYSRMCIGGCAPILGCTANPGGCSGPVVGLSLFDNITSNPCGTAAEDNCTAPQYGGSGCRGVFVRDIANLWGGTLSPQLTAADLAFLDGTTMTGARYTAIHTTLQQLAYRVAVVTAHEVGHSMGAVAQSTTAPCAMSGGLCSGGSSHNDCRPANVMRAVTSFTGTFTPATHAFSGRPGGATSAGACYSGGISTWTLLTTFAGTTP